MAKARPMNTLVVSYRLYSEVESCAVAVDSQEIIHYHFTIQFKHFGCAGNAFCYNQESVLPSDINTRNAIRHKRTQL